MQAPDEDSFEKYQEYNLVVVIKLVVIIKINCPLKDSELYIGGFNYYYFTIFNYFTTILPGNIDNIEVWDH